MTHKENQTTTAFKSFADLKAALRQMPAQPESDWFEALIVRVRESPDSRTIAFKALAEIALERRPFTRLQRIKPDLEEVFYDGHYVEVYTNDPELTRKKLEHLFISCSGTRDLREFYGELHYLIALLPVIQAIHAPDLFEERLCLFSEVFVKHARQSRIRPNAKKAQRLEVRPVDIAVILLNLTPNSGGQPKKLEDLLNAVEYLRELWESRLVEAKGLAEQIVALKSGIDEQEARIAEKSDELAHLSEKVIEKSDRIASLEADLAKKQELLDSQQHLIGHQEASAKRDSYTRFSRRLNRHLENVRLFADREQPNRDGILEELNDIERFMSNFEEEL